MDYAVKFLTYFSAAAGICVILISLYNLYLVVKSQDAKEIKAYHEYLRRKKAKKRQTTAQMVVDVKLQGTLMAARLNLTAALDGDSLTSWELYPTDFNYAISNSPTGEKETAAMVN